jgi:hypothetical protein
MKGGTHDIVIVTGQDTQARSLVKVPETKGLIVTSRQDPRKLRRVGMKLDGANIIQMTQEGKETTAQFVIPYFDLVVITTGYNERICQVKVDATDGSIVLFKTINDGSDPIIPAVVTGECKNRSDKFTSKNKKNQPNTVQFIFSL